MTLVTFTTTCMGVFDNVVNTNVVFMFWKLIDTGANKDTRTFEVIDLPDGSGGIVVVGCMVVVDVVVMFFFVELGNKVYALSILCV